jgi:hypothetical protein
MRRLLIDIETSPNLAHVWDLWNQNVGLSQLIETGEMLCFGAKWYGEPGETEFYSTWDDGHQIMVACAYTLLDQADAVIHYNGRKFDVPWLNRGFLEYGWPPPAPYKQIDLLDTVKKQFRFPSNKLDYVANRLGVGSKVHHEGHDLWVKVMQGDPEARQRFREYNVQDVELLGPLYERLQPWIPSHPSVAALEGRDVCPACGSDSLIKQGYAYIKTGTYQRYVCQVCGKWSRSTKRSSGTSITEVAA